MKSNKQKTVSFYTYIRKAFLLLANPAAIVVAAIFALSALAGFVSPEKIKLFALAGLFFPLLYLLTLLVLVILVILRSKWIWLHLALLILSFPIALRFFGNTPQQKATGWIAISYNVHGFKGYANKEKAKTPVKIGGYFHNTQADFICIQEFRSWSGNKEADIESLKQLSGLEHHHYNNYLSRGGLQSDGFLIMSRFPIHDFGAISTQSRRNICAFVDVVPSLGDTIRITTIHLASFSLDKQEIDAFGYAANLEMDLMKKHGKSLVGKLGNSFKIRANEINELNNFIHSSPYPLVLCGDFNDTPASYTYNMIRKSGLSDSHLKAGFGIGTTYAGKLPWLRIDYCFGSQSIRFYKSEVNKLPFSDHYPLKVHFQLESVP